MKEKMGNYVFIKTGRLDANAASPNGNYPFFTCAVEPLAISTYSYDCECVLVAGNGDLNVKYYNGKFDAYQRTYIIESRDKTVLSVPYLYFFLMKYVEELRTLAIGGVIKYIKLGNLTEAKLPIPPLREQEKTVQKLQTLTSLICKKKLQLQKLDQLASSRFIEMFGDPVANPKGWSIKKIKEVVAKQKNALKAGPFGSALKKEFYTPSGYKIYGQEQVINGDAEFGDYYISQEKYAELKSCAIQAKDVLISLVGTYGKTLVIPDEFEPGIINPRLIKITFDQSVINVSYFQAYFSSESLKAYLDVQTHGCTMGVLNLGIISNLLIPLPPLSLQNEFAAFVEQLDKSKVICNKMHKMVEFSLFRV